MRHLIALSVVAVLAGCAGQPVSSVAPVSSAAASSATAQANKRVIENFYQAFQKLDANTMANSYSADATFSDPVFPDLHGQQVGDMWRMLGARAQNFSVVFDDVRADEQSGDAHWVATYTFSQTGRTVVNDVHSHFTFRDGKIATQHDRFDLWHWSIQALGVKGRLLGWTPLVRNKIQHQAGKALKDYQHEHGH
jgi:ketosteroid isomerase-like protein